MVASVSLCLLLHIQPCEFQLLLGWVGPIHVYPSIAVLVKIYISNRIT